MEIKFNKCVLLSFLFLLIITTCGTTAEHPKFTVHLYLPLVSERYKNEITSYFKRELREINDIRLVDKDGDFFISVVAKPIMIEGQDDGIGIAISYVFEYESLRLHNVISINENDLKSECQKIVAMFDTQFVEPIRDEWSYSTTLTFKK